MTPVKTKYLLLPIVHKLKKLDFQLLLLISGDVLDMVLLNNLHNLAVFSLSFSSAGKGQFLTGIF